MEASSRAQPACCPSPTAHLSASIPLAIDVRQKPPLWAVQEGSLAMRNMLERTILLIAAMALSCVSVSPASGAEREDVRKVINLVTAVKMPYPENLNRNRARTE